MSFCCSESMNCWRCGFVYLTPGRFKLKLTTSAGSKPGPDLLQFPERANHQTGADDQDHCERNLGDHETLTQRLTASADVRCPAPRIQFARLRSLTCARGARPNRKTATIATAIVNPSTGSPTLISSVRGTLSGANNSRTFNPTNASATPSIEAIKTRTKPFGEKLPDHSFDTGAEREPDRKLAMT